MLTKKIKTIFYVLLLVSLCGAPASVYAFDVLLGTGAPGSFSYFSGRVLCRMINHKVDDVNCRQVPATDDVHNLTNLQGGSLDISLVDSRMLFNAINKTGNFEFLDISYKNVRALAPLYDVPITLIVRKDAGIASLDDLKGKRINAGTPGSLQYLGVNTILKAKKWSRNDFSLVGDLPPIKAQDTKAFCYGTMQAMVYIGIHPDFSLRRLLKTCNGSLLNMNDREIGKLVNDDPAFWKIDLAAGTYPSHPEKVATFGTRAMLVAADSLDNETVYKIIEAIDKNRECLTDAHAALSLFSVDLAQKGTPGIQLHPGAAMYFDKH
ncbi:MAG: TAXI family TRAP transporter solute-binding subunit [Thermodesulfobacteriota bacterium]|nr:TAXI family TRAP transporter solute-binding subunit [Thermodesulfobacteriota bacterium]